MPMQQPIRKNVIEALQVLVWNTLECEPATTLNDGRFDGAANSNKPHSNKYNILIRSLTHSDWHVLHFKKSRSDAHIQIAHTEGLLRVK